MNDAMLIVRQKLEELRNLLEAQMNAEIKACRAKFKRLLDEIDAMAASPNLGVPRFNTLFQGEHDDPELQRLLQSFPNVVAEQNLKRLQEMATSQPSETARSKVNVMTAVRTAVERTSGRFTSRMLVLDINQRENCEIAERDVSHPLWRLRKEGAIAVARNGAGRRPSVYLKVTHAGAKSNEFGS